MSERKSRQTRRQMTKKDLRRKKPHPEDGHWEGKYWCDCKVRNRRKLLARHGKSTDDTD